MTMTTTTATATLPALPPSTSTTASASASAVTVASHSHTPNSSSCNNTRPFSRSSRRSNLNHAASTPSLNGLYTSHSSLSHSRLGGGNGAPFSSAGPLGRKASLAALTENTLASIPDESDSYAMHSVMSENTSPSRANRMGPVTPGRAGAATASDYAVGEMVDVPGNMHGMIRFVGSVNGRKGTYVGVELHSDFAARGKNNGDVDGVSYFNTSVPGAGIFVPIHKLIKHEGQPPLTPTGNSVNTLKVANQNSTSFTPPTPSLPKFSQSVGPSRAQSPVGKKGRTSLPRPDSPVRRLQLTPAPRPSLATPAPRPPGPGQVPPRYGSPALNKFSASVRGTAGDPSKANNGVGMNMSRRPSMVPPRSASALGQVRPPSSHYSNEDDVAPLGSMGNRSVHANNKNNHHNNSIGSLASLNLKMRPSSRAAAVNDEEIERLRSQLEERDRQLKEQASALAEMESSVAELTSLMEQTDPGKARSGSFDDKDKSQLRAMLRERNEKIAMLTAEFDAHRADFRSTIDTLEMASTETQRVYDAKIRELEQEIQEAQTQHSDVDSVARQLKQLEELVQELEEGLEDARRGEAEARGEVEFLRGEVERTRSELRREREKSSVALNGSGSAGGSTGGNNGEDALSSMSKDLEKREDEIRGLKAIIHSLNRDYSLTDNASDKTSTLTATHPQRNASLKNNSNKPNGTESADIRLSRDKYEREISELRSVLDSKNNREEELERELQTLRRGSASTFHGSSSLTTNGTNTTDSSGSNERSASYRDSKATIVLEHKRNPTADTTAESDTYSSVTENSTLWCEICETSGHDILTCTNMFGPGEGKNSPKPNGHSAPRKTPRRDALTALSVPAADEEFVPRPLTPVKTPTPTSAVKPMASKAALGAADSNALAGKESGVVDLQKWCALCERDGHDSIDCPLEDM